MALTNIIKTTKEIVPIIYAFTTPEIKKHNGWTKIGETNRKAEKRIEEQTFTADVDYKLEWKMTAMYEGTNEVFRDYDFHSYLQKNGIERLQKKNYRGQIVDVEWFKILPMDARKQLEDFRFNRGVVEGNEALTYTLRDEQAEAVEMTKKYFEQNSKKAEFLWNAKPRFGKTLSTYDLILKLNLKNVLIVTNRPAIANSWYEDYEKFLGTKSGYYFISETDYLKGKKCVLSREQFLKSSVVNNEGYKGAIHFVSLQDLKGSIYFGGYYDKLDYLYKGNKEKSKGLTFELLVIDEAHEGVDTYKTDQAFNNINRRWTLHLSGTPFKALASDKFEESAIYNWTYADEQNAKESWNDEDRSNPYLSLPRLNLLTYKMSDIVLDKAKLGADFNDDGDNEAYAFDLNEFFKTNDSGFFIHDKEIDIFLDALTNNKKFPFTSEYRDELKHTLWILNRVSSAKALYNKLKKHNIFSKYEIVLAAGDGKTNIEDSEVDDEKLNNVRKSSYDKVVDAINHSEKTITISVGQLTTGITIPKWTAVMMLSNMKSPALYMQAAFRAQNPCDFKEGNKIYRKENAYIFDFDPARTLDIYEQFSNGLYTNTASLKGDTEIRKKHVKELLNYFPVYAEDDNGEMIELDAEKVLSIPRSIHAKEVVRRGFMCNFLFQNITGIFSASSVVSDIITKFEPVDDSVLINRNTKQELSIDENGDVNIDNKTIIGKANEVFGNKIYKNIEKDLQIAVHNAQKNILKKEDDAFDKIKMILHQKITQRLLDEVKENYGKDMSKSRLKEVSNSIDRTADKTIDKFIGKYKTNDNLIKYNKEKEILKAKEEGRIKDINKIKEKYEKEQLKNQKILQTSIDDCLAELIKDAGTCIVSGIETEKNEKIKKSIEDKVREHLRGFSRCIPSFLMAYGNDNTTLQNFDKVIPPNVFLEVTSITIDEFRFLRDGGDYNDKEDNNKKKHFDGKLFDEVVFNDSIKEFLKKKIELSNYFDENLKEDIFDYIPPQKTNQIFTPRNIVVKMVDYLEKENPGCFDNPNATFIDLYMKSGLYITEIVKRLYRSKKMKKLFPDDIERLKNIFEKQVYGLASTDIIYAIATNYIFGFIDNKQFKIDKKHFKMLDALPYAQNKMDKTLKQKLDEIMN